MVPLTVPDVNTVVAVAAVPDGLLHDRAVSELHAVPSQALKPTRTPPVYETCP